MSSKGTRVVVVTGASRGAGKGIALALGATGATVYVTGRTAVEGTAPLPGTVFETAAEITKLGGIGVPVVCDHADDAQVKAPFDRVAAESGHVDILVNNAAVIPEGLIEHGPFWKRPLGLIDMIEVGARSSFVSSWYAAPLLVKSAGGLVVNTSSFGGGCYMHGPAYGAAKAAVDKMAHDMAIDFEPYGVCAVSIWMALLKTERTQKLFDANPDTWGLRASSAETPQFIGQVIDSLARDPKRMERSGKVWIAAELGREYGLKNADRSEPLSQRATLGGPWDFNPAIIA